MRKTLLLPFIFVALILSGCRQADAEINVTDVVVDVEVASDSPEVGVNNILVTVSTLEGDAIEDATVSITGNMTHAGMVPVSTFPITENSEGVYELPIELTMGGDWIFEVNVELANGEATSVVYQLDGVEGEAMDMSGMDMSDEDMDMDAMSTAVSGAYMMITNTSDDDLTLVSAGAETVGMIQIHETTVDENDIARMQELEDGVLIPAGETVSLEPGGMHIMLMNLEADLLEGETLTLMLEFDDESIVELALPITNEAPQDDASVETDSLTITDFWARPTAVDAMDMSDDEDMDDMEMEAEATEASE